MWAFVPIRQLIANLIADRVGDLEKRMKELKDYMEEGFAGYNDINEDTQMQLELSTKRWPSFRPKETGWEAT